MLTADDDVRVDDVDSEEDEFAEADGEEVTTDLDESEDGEDGEDEIDAVVELTSKEQSVRSLEIRRAIERRMEERQLHEDVDYLDIDLDD